VSFIKRKLFHYFVGVRAALPASRSQQAAVPFIGRFAVLGWATCWSTAPLKNVLGLPNVRIAIRPVRRSAPNLFSFYRSSPESGKQLYGQTEAFLYLTAQPDGQIFSTRRPALPNVDLRIAENGRGCCSSPRHVRHYFKDESQDPGGDHARWLCEDRRCRLLRQQDGHLKIIDAPRRRKLNDGTLFPPKYIENKLSSSPNIREAVAYGDGRDFAAV